MNLRLLRLMVLAELRQHLRDPLTILFMVVLPLVLYPGMAAVGHVVVQEDLARAEARVLAVATDPAFPVSETLKRVEVDDLAEAVREGRVEAAVRRTEDGVELFWDSRRPQSLDARERLVDDLTAWRKDTQERRVDSVDRSSPAEGARRSAARWLPALLLFTLVSGGIYTALDLVTGDKERGTLETLLTTAVDRRAVVLAKFLVVLLFTLVSAGLSLASGWASAVWFLKMSLPGTAVLLATALVLPLAVLLAAVLTAAASWAPDFKSGQVLATPALILPSLLASVAAVPGVTLNAFTALIPVSGLALATRDVVAGTANAPLVLLSFIAASAWAAGSLRWAVRSLGREDVILGSRGGAQRRLRGDYRADALMLAGASFAALWFLGQTAQGLDLEWGMLATQAGLFVPLALAAPWWLGLPVRATLGLQGANGRQWLRAAAVGLLMPGVALAVGAAQSAVMEAPTQLFEGMFDPETPLWAMLFLFALLPGVCEELLFRGAFFGLWRPKSSPGATVLVTALVFGLFHLSVFRFFPTFALGLVLGVLRVRSGSVLPAMLAHTMNNSFGMLALHFAWPVEPDWRAFAAALGVLALLLAG